MKIQGLEQTAELQHGVKIIGNFADFCALPFDHTAIQYDK